MAVKYLSHLETLNINMQGYELQNAVIHTLTNNTRPINPNVGQVMYNTDNQTLELWDGVNWSSVSGDITSITITTGVGLQGGVVGVTGAVTGNISLNHLGLEDLVDPNKDSIFYWNDLTKKSEFLDIGDGLLINSGVLSNTIINNDQLINGSGYITADSSDTLTNKSGNISQWTNDVGYITDGNTNWNNTYGFITGINWDEITGNQLDINLSGFNNDSGFTTFDGDYNSLSNLPTIPTNNNQLINGAGYITTGNDGWVNTYGFITGVNWDEIGGLQSDINLSGFTNDVGFVSGDEFDSSGTYLNLRAQATTKGDVGLGNVENISLSTYTGNGGSLDNQYIINSEGYITGINWDGIGGTQSDINLSGFTNDIGFSTFDGDYNSLTNIPTYTQGSIIFADSDGSLTENNSQLYWDNVNNRLGIGTTNPTEKLEIIGNLNLYDPNNNSKITFRNIPYSNYIKSDGYATHFGIRGNLGNGNVIFENNLDTQQLILIQPTTIGWNLNTTKPLGVNGLFSIDNILSIYNKQSVGIGISNPTEKLDVNGNIKADGILKLYDITDTQKISLNPDGDSYINGKLAVGKTTNISYPFEVQDNDTNISTAKQTLARFYRNDGTYNPRLEIRTSTDGIDIFQTYTTLARNLTISNPSGEVLRINSNGNVGIGTTNSGTKLYISGDPALNAIGTQSLLRLERPFNSGVSFAQGADIAIGRGNTYPSTQMRFILDNGTNNPTNPQTTIMTLDSSGNVGIGTTSPTEILDVNGNIKADGNLKLYDVTDTQTIELNPGGDSYINGGNVGIGTTSPNDKLDIDGDIRVKRTNRKPTHEDVLTSDFVSVGSVSFYTDDWVKVKVIGRGDSGVNKSFAEYLIYYDGANYNIELLNNIVIGDNSGFPLLRMNGSNLEIKNRDSVNVGNYLIYFDDFISQTLFSGKTYRVEDFPLIWINDLYYSTYKDNTFVPNQNILIPNQSEYDVVTIINLETQSLTTDITSNFLNKFNNLNDLRLYNNQISVLDVSQSVTLTFLSCPNNQLSVLNVSQCTNLTQLYCYINQIQILDVSNLTNLIALYCHANEIQMLDVSNLTNLSNLRCQDNLLDAATNSQILIDLDGHGLSNGFLRSSIFGGGSLTTAGQTAKSNLLSKGWTIVGI